MKNFTSFFVFMYTYIYTYLQTHKRFPLKNKPYAAPSLAFNMIMFMSLLIGIHEHFFGVACLFGESNKKQSNDTRLFHYLYDYKHMLISQLQLFLYNLNSISQLQLFLHNP